MSLGGICKMAAGVAGTVCTGRTSTGGGAAGGAPVPSTEAGSVAGGATDATIAAGGGTTGTVEYRPPNGAGGGVVRGAAAGCPSDPVGGTALCAAADAARYHRGIESVPVLAMLVGSRRNCSVRTLLSVPDQTSGADIESQLPAPLISQGCRSLLDRVTIRSPRLTKHFCGCPFTHVRQKNAIELSSAEKASQEAHIVSAEACRARDCGPRTVPFAHPEGRRRCL